MQSAKKGFTLIELLVVVAISAIISAFTIQYGKIGQNQVALSVEAAKISQFILEAKQLSIATYTTSAATCAYGVLFDYPNQTYSLFAFTPTGAPPCPTLASTTAISAANVLQYQQQSWKVHVAPGVVLKNTAADALSVVIFYPPQPATLLSRDGTTLMNPADPLNLPQTSRVYLTTRDGSANNTISVNPAGQVSL